MKKLFLTLSLVGTSLVYAQAPTKFEISQKNGFTDFVVTKVRDMSKEDLYNKTLEWIKKTYKDPRDIIKTDLENDFIKIESIKEGLRCTAPQTSKVCYDVKYEIEISFKDNKYMFDVTQMEYYEQPTEHKKGGWLPLYPNNDASMIFDKEGNLKYGMKNYYQDVPNFFNDLNEQIKNYVEFNERANRKTDW